MNLKEAISILEQLRIDTMRADDHLLFVEKHLLPLLRSLESQQQECRDLRATFDLRFKADMRAIKRWQAAHPGKELTWPDHADLVCWLVGELDHKSTKREYAVQRQFMSRAAWHHYVSAESAGEAVRLAEREQEEENKRHADPNRWKFRAVSRDIKETVIESAPQHPESGPSACIGYQESEIGACAVTEDARPAGSESSGTTPVVSKSPQAQGHGESSSSQDSLPPASTHPQPVSESKQYRVRGIEFDWVVEEWENGQHIYDVARFYGRDMEQRARDYAEAMNARKGNMMNWLAEWVHELNVVTAERDQLRKQMSQTREWLNAWEAGLFTADQCLLKLRSELAERKDY